MKKKRGIVLSYDQSSVGHLKISSHLLRFMLLRLHLKSGRTLTLRNTVDSGICDIWMSASYAVSCHWDEHQSAARGPARRDWIVHGM